MVFMVDRVSDTPLGVSRCVSCTFCARFTACGNDLVMTYARKEVLPFPGSLSLEIPVFSRGPGEQVGRGNDLRPGGG